MSQHILRYESLTLVPIAEQHCPQNIIAEILTHQCVWLIIFRATALCKKATMLVTSKNVLFPGHNHSANHWYGCPSTLLSARVPARVIFKVLGHRYRWLVEWLWPENMIFSEVASMVVTWWMMAFLHCGICRLADLSGVCIGIPWFVVEHVS